MRRRFGKALISVIVTTGIFATAALANEDGGKSAFAAFIERLVSTPDRQVSLSGLEGAFSANPRVERITVSDREGPWLELAGVEVLWSRAALFERRLQIDSLRARRVAVLRKPLPPEKPQSGGGFSGMPIAVVIDAVSLPQIVLAAPVAGVEAELAAAGSANLTEEALAAQLSVYRQDRAGILTVELRLEPGAHLLTADLTLEEPAGGIIAELFDLPNRPAISAKLSGQGPLDSWDATLGVTAGGEDVLDGSVAISRVEASYRVVADMTASLETLAPPGYAAFVAGESRLTLDVTRADDGAIAIDEATLRSGGTDLAGSGVLAPDLVPENAVLSLRLGQAGRATLPLAPGEVSVASLQVNAELERGAAAPWRVGIVAEGIESAFGSLSRLALSASGEAENLARPSERSISFQANGTLEGLAPDDVKLRAAIGPELRLAADGSWSAGGPVGFDNLQVVLNAAAASFAGTATAEELDGSFGATVGDLSRFAGLAGRAVAGGAQLKASGTATRGGRFELRLDGETVDLALGIAGLDPLLAGATKLQGGIARSDAGISFDDLVLANERMTAAINGALAEPTLDLTVTADVADLSLVTERAAGRAHVSAQLTGTTAAPRVDAEATGEEIVLMGRPLADASASFSGVVAGPDTAGDAKLSGTLAGAPVSGSARLSAGEGGARRIEGLTFTVGESRVTGDLAIGADGLFTGNVTLVSPDLSKVAPLFLVEASGMLRADIALAAENGAQSAALNGTAADVIYQDVTLDTAEFAGEARDLFTAPRIDGDFSLRNLQAGGLTIVSASGAAERSGESTALSAEAELANGHASLDARLEPRDGGLAIGLQRFSFQHGRIDLALSTPATIVVDGGAAKLDNATLKFDAGSATISGRAGETLDLSVSLASVPASLVNSFAPELGAEGTVSGSVSVSGTAAAPVAQFDIQMAGASVAASRNAGLGPLDVSADGEFADKRVQLTSRIGGADGMAVNVTGTVGTAEGAPLDLTIAGAAPLSLGNRQFASRGAALRGALDVDIKVSGTAASPQFAGRVTSEGGGFVDPQTGIVLSNLSVVASVSNNRLVIERLTAASGEGTVAAEGSLGLDPNEGLPIDMRANIRQARYVDGTLIAAKFDADLTLSGRLTDAPLLAGSVSLDRTEITVPERLPGSSVAVDVEHVTPPAPVERTLAILRERDSQRQAGGGGPSGITLDVAVNAPRQVFVRGRGLDTEFGGRLHLGGPISSVVTAGFFEIVRGRLDILTQRIVLDRGIITFAGDLDPMLDFIGTTQSGDVTITVAISGRASDPQVTFSSTPELPQDQILAQLIFQKGIGELSPFQIARLAAAASELSGGSGGGLLSQLRATTGLDDLDIVVDEKGEAALAAGRYIGENVYLGVEQGATTESSRVTIDLDITKGVKARAGYSAEGESSLGIFFEREY
jgi:translocation and assembly module TamB